VSLEEAPDIEIEVRRETPDLLRIGRQIAHHAAQHADACQQRQGEQFAAGIERRERDQDARNQASDVAGEDAGQEGALEAQVRAIVSGVAGHAGGDAGAENDAQPDGQFQPLAERAALPHQHGLEAIGARQNAGDGGHGGQLHQQRNQVALQHSVLEAIIMEAVRVPQ
jgi:hypothetical protein